MLQFNIGGQSATGDLMGGWKIDESATPIDILDTNGSVGGASATFGRIPQNTGNGPTQTPGASSDYLHGQSCTIIHDTLGTIKGTVLQVVPTGSQAQIDVSTPLSVLNVNTTMKAYQDGQVFYSWQRKNADGTNSTVTIGDMTTDPTTGNVWITGGITGANASTLHDRFGNFLLGLTHSNAGAGIRVDSTGNIYVLTQTTIEKFNPAGVSIGPIATAPTGVNYMMMAMDSSGNLWVGTNDTTVGHAFYKYGPTGTLLLQLGTYAMGSLKPTTDPNGLNFNAPRSIAIVPMSSGYDQVVVPNWSNDAGGQVPSQITVYGWRSSDGLLVNHGNSFMPPDVVMNNWGNTYGSTTIARMVMDTTKLLSQPTNNSAGTYLRALFPSGLAAMDSSLSPVAFANHVNNGLALNTPSDSTGAIGIACDRNGGSTWIFNNTTVYRLAGGYLGPNQALECYMGAVGYRGSASTTTRTNLSVDPQGTAVHTPSANIQFLNRWFGGTGFGGTYTVMTGVSDGPIPSITTYDRKQWTQVTGGQGNDVSVTLTQGSTPTGSFPVNPGDTYTFSFWWRMSWAFGGTLGSSLINHMEAVFYNSSGTQVGSTLKTADTNPAAPGAWQQQSITLTVPAGVAYMNMTHMLYPGAAQTVNCYIDVTGILAERSATLGSYFDGSFARSGGTVYAWNGTANNASSTALTITTPVTYGANTPYYDSASNGSPFPAWTGSAWSRIKELCAVANRQITTDGIGVRIIRTDNRSDQTKISIDDRDASPQITEGQPGAQIINVTSQNVATPASGFGRLYAAIPSSSLITTDVSGVTVATIQANVYATAFQQPVQTYGTDPMTLNYSAYRIVDSSSPPVEVKNADWSGNGGSVMVKPSAASPGSIDVILTGPAYISGTYTGPFSIGQLSGSTKQGALSLFGAGFTVTPQTVQVYTSAPITVVLDINSTTMDSPFLVSMNAAYNAARFSATTLGSGALTISNLNIPVASLPVGFGRVAGGYFFWKRNYWRITDVSYNGGWATITATRDTRTGEVQDGNTTHGAIDTIWSGFRYHDNYLSPGILGA